MSNLDLVILVHRAKDVVIAIALGFLIYAHLQVIPNTGKGSNVTLTSVTTLPPMQQTQLVLPASTATAWFGDADLYGTLNVSGCILWQQPRGQYRNSCNLFQSFLLDCVHGYYDGTVCRCEESWLGPVCNRHTCYGRGLFNPVTQACECYSRNYTVASYCRLQPSIPVILPCLPTCQGRCRNGTCICTRLGQLGQNCYECASPVINYTLCPGRVNWGKEYILDDEIGICGGGYEFTGANTLVIRGLHCQVAGCADFHQSKAICCFPGAVNSRCVGWFKYRFDQPFAGPSVFSSIGVCRQRYLQILTEHAGAVCERATGNYTHESCRGRAYALLNDLDWQLLSVDPTVNAAVWVRLDTRYFLTPTVAIRETGYTVTPTLLYFWGTSFYNRDIQYRYIFYYDRLDMYCLEAPTVEQLLWSPVTQSTNRCGRFLITPTSISSEIKNLTISAKGPFCVWSNISMLPITVVFVV